MGGGCILTEVPEMFGAEHVLMARAESKEVFHSIVSLINDYKKYYENIKNEIWNKYYVELQNHCSKCPYYHVQSFEQMKDARRTTHRCKKLSTDYRDEYSRGYYQIMDLGTICPISNKQITSKNISEVMKLANNRAYIEIYKENNNYKIEKKT